VTPAPAEDGRAAQVDAAVSAAHADSWARVVAAAARASGGNLTQAEDAASEAFLQALQTWGSRGVPRDPAAWLIRTAHRKVVDQQRREATLRRKLPVLATTDAAPREDAVDIDALTALDDRLRLVFTCCHPALAMQSRVALTLRLVGGLTTAEIAAGMLVSDAALAARITRAKRKIETAKIPYRVPPESELVDRLDGVLTVIHLISTTGHTAPAGGALRRSDLADRALDLSAMLAVLLPDEPEVLGLLALLELTEARAPARVDAEGAPVLLSDQDRARWDADRIAAGLQWLDRARQRLGPDRAAGRFLLQAGIAAAHADADTFADTDWSAIVALYDRLLERWPSPVVALNRAVAIAFRDGPSLGLAAIDEVAGDARLARYHYVPAARADLLRRLGRRAAARQEYRRALALVDNDAERRFLQRRLDSLADDVGDTPVTGSHQP